MLFATIFLLLFTSSVFQKLTNDSTYGVLRLTQPPTLRGMGNEKYLTSYGVKA